MDKKTEAMTVHLSEKRKKQVLKLADSNGMTGSEFICSLIENRLEVELINFRLLQDVFDFDGTNNSGENR